jgi:hypothetical protein
MQFVHRSPYVVNPDHVAAINGHSVSTPHILRVDISEADVLNNDVLYAVRHPDALSLNDTLGALADKRLVRSDGHANHTSLVVLNAGDLRSFRLVDVAPSVLVDSDLAATAGAPWAAPRGCGTTFGTSEVESLRKNDDARRRVLEIVDEFRSGFRVNGLSIASSSHT